MKTKNHKRNSISSFKRIRNRHFYIVTQKESATISGGQPREDILIDNIIFEDVVAHDPILLNWADNFNRPVIKARKRSWFSFFRSLPSLRNALK